MNTLSLQEKLNLLKENIKRLGSLAVAFSGGVDSSFLLAIAHEVLGENVIAVTGSAVQVPERELSEAERFCKERGIRQFVCRVDPFQDEAFRFNAPDRCYVCKRRIFSQILQIAQENGMAYVAEGSNMDDLGDYRPGMRAIEELKVKSPLRDAGLYKSEIRSLSKEMQLPTWSKPAYACLASRFVYGEEITEEKLRMVDEAEQILISLGFPKERVRMHGMMARIEVPQEEIARLASDENRQYLFDALKKIGFRFVTLDLGGYRTGSMNDTIPRENKEV